MILAGVRVDSPASRSCRERAAIDRPRSGGGGRAAVQVQVQVLESVLVPVLVPVLESVLESVLVPAPVSVPDA